jgi:hypothetical protein
MAGKDQGVPVGVAAISSQYTSSLRALRSPVSFLGHIVPQLPQSAMANATGTGTKIVPGSANITSSGIGSIRTSEHHPNVSSPPHTRSTSLSPGPGGSGLAYLNSLLQPSEQYCCLSDDEEEEEEEDDTARGRSPSAATTAASVCSSASVSVPMFKVPLASLSPNPEERQMRHFKTSLLRILK